MRRRRPTQLLLVLMSTRGRIATSTAVLVTGLLLAGLAIMYWIHTRSTDDPRVGGAAATLVLTSPAANARASVNGEDRGRLPLVVDALLPGETHYVKVEAAEHAPVVREIVLESGERRIEAFILRRLTPGELHPAQPDKPLVSPETGLVADGVFEEGLALFRDDKLAKASKHFQTIRKQSPDPEIQGRAQALSERIERFMQLHRKIRDPVTPEAAIPDLVLQAVELDREIDPGGPHVRKLQGRLVSGLRNRGRTNASQGKLLAARSDFLRCLEFAPGHEGCRRSLDGLGEQARKLYYAAYLQRRQNPDGSAQMLREVLGTLERDDPVFAKAEQLLRLVGKPGQ